MEFKVFERLWWATPVWECPVEDIDNKSIAEYCYKVRDEKPGVNISNRGGWHSGELITPIPPALDQLFNDLTIFANDVPQRYIGTSNLVLGNWWININGKYDYNEPHDQGDLGDVWHEEGKKKLKKNTFLDYIACANHLIEQRYTSKGGICFYGGSAGGLTGGAVANMAPDLFFSMLLLVPFVDTMTTMLNEKLPLTPAEWELWGNPIKNKDYFEYILSYAPYNNIEKKDYPPMLITTSLFDNRVLYSEPVKYIAKLREIKTDSNTQLLKCKMEAAGHGGMSGRDNAITELAEEYSFILKTAKILN